VVKNALLTALGILCLLIGAIGAALPVLPTTPFVLLGAGCFSAGNPALFERLSKVRFFGEFIAHYKQKSGVSRKTKAISLVWLWAMLFVGMLHAGGRVMPSLLALIGLCVSAHILLLRPKRQGGCQAAAEEESEF